MLNIQTLIDDAKCFETVRTLRWPEEVPCLQCRSTAVTKQGRDPTQPERQKYCCCDCGRWFDDLTGTAFAGHHQPLRTWVLCLYLMGLNLSNRQIASELGLNKDDAQRMTAAPWTRRKRPILGLIQRSGDADDVGAGERATTDHPADHPQLRPRGHAVLHR
jgi:transposase-like protein